MASGQASGVTTATITIGGMARELGSAECS